jgi:hypothetical protein
MTTVEEQQEYESTAEEREYWGKKLLVAAWVIEIIAAFVGLMIAWSMGLQTYQVYTKGGVDFPIGKMFDLFLAALPFVMVASVELLKIPFSYLIYINRNKKVKRIFSVVLVLVTFITFETLLTGFERQYANITTEVDIPRNELAVVENTIKNKETELTELEIFTIESITDKANTHRDNAEKSKNEDLAILEESKSNYLASGNADLIERKKAYQEDINIKTKKRDVEITRLEKNNQILGEEELSNQKNVRADNNRQIQILQNEKRENKKRIDNKDAEMGFLSGLSTDIKEWKDRNNQIDIEISALRQLNASQLSSSASDFKKESTRIYNEYEKEIDSIYQKISSINQQIAKNSQFKSEIANIDKRKQERYAKYSSEIKKVEDFVAAQEKRLSTKGARVDVLNAELSPLRDKSLELENKVLAAYSTTQIYRIARTVYGVERGVLIPEEDIALVAKVWFGSLAGIVSTMGIALAFGAFILRHPIAAFHEEERRNRRNGSIRRALRLMLRALRKRFKEPKIVTKIKEVEVPKEVIKEVPVDKVVFKEIPIEVIQKEVIHIPIYTNDPDLIKFGTTKVKDIIKDD